jgi:hypothetical protein
MATRKVFDLGQRDRVHRALCFRRAMPKRQYQHAARAQQREQLAHSPFALAGRDMLPHGAEQDQVERKAEPVDGGQRRQPVGHPAQTLSGMSLFTFGPHSSGRLDGDHVVSQLGKPRRIPAS